MKTIARPWRATICAKFTIFLRRLWLGWYYSEVLVQRVVVNCSAASAIAALPCSDPQEIAAVAARALSVHMALDGLADCRPADRSGCRSDSEAARSNLDYSGCRCLKFQ